MRIVIAGGHGKIAQLLGKALVQRGDSVVGIVRNPDHVADLAELGMEAAVADMESSSVAAIADIVDGAGAGSGAARKDTVDRAAALLLAQAALRVGVERYLLVSSMGVESVRNGATPPGVDEVFVAYLRAKLAAEVELLARDNLDLTILRPGGLTDDPATGRVWLAPNVDRGRVPRADVAAVLIGFLDRRPATRVLELVGGDTPLAEALAAVS
jgi:nucleoside-diphosphate-sugar epimerase